MLISSPVKKMRNRVDLSTRELARQWCKHFGVSKQQIEAAVEKVGDNPGTVEKQLRSDK